MAVVFCGVVNRMENHHQERGLPRLKKKEKVDEVADGETTTEENRIAHGEEEKTNSNQNENMSSTRLLSTEGQTEATTNVESVLQEGEQFLSTGANANNNLSTTGARADGFSTNDAAVATTMTSTSPSTNSKRVIDAESVRKSVEAAVENVAAARVEKLKLSVNVEGSKDEEQSTEEGNARTEVCSGALDASPTVKRSRKKRTPPPVQPGQSTGRWTHREHESFLAGLKVYGREWKKVAKYIPTRTSAQVRSHAQKYFAKLARDEVMSTGGSQQESQVQFSNEVATAAAASSLGGSNITPSVRRNVERILANPNSVQSEVEEKLRALRERYRQLQRRLEEEQHSSADVGPQRSLSDGESMVVEDDGTNDAMDDDNNSSNNSNNEGNDRQLKRRREGTAREDDATSVSSATLSSLGNEELIALSVLGGALQNGGSGIGVAAVAAGSGAFPGALAGGSFGVSHLSSAAPASSAHLSQNPGQHNHQSSTTNSSLGSVEDDGEGYSSSASDSTSSAKQKMQD